MIFIFTVARSVKCGRRLAGMHKSKDVLNTQTQQRFGFKVEALPASTATSQENLYALVNGQRDHDASEERLQDNTVTPVPDQAAFRLDWPRFLNALSQRDQEMALFLSLGHSNKHASQKFKLSPGRVTQLRQQWLKEWRIFQGEE
jgi:hypothetical protein